MKFGAKSAATALALSALAAGCAGPVKTRIAGTGPGIRPPASFAILPAEEDAPKPDAATETALRGALQKAGYALADDAPYLVDYSVAERSARTGISATPSGDWLSEEKPKRPFASCKEKTHRITLTITERATGAALYKGTAEEHHCRATLAESRDALISAILTDLPQPQGKREFRRVGRN